MSTPFESPPTFENDNMLFLENWTVGAEEFYCFFQLEPPHPVTLRIGVIDVEERILCIEDPSRWHTTQ